MSRASEFRAGYASAKREIRDDGWTKDLARRYLGETKLSEGPNRNFDEGFRAAVARRAGVKSSRMNPKGGSVVYHVYAEDGFESAHTSLKAAIRVAKRGAARRRMVYEVVRADQSGMTGGGHGTVVFKTPKSNPKRQGEWTRRGRREKSLRPRFGGISKAATKWLKKKFGELAAEGYKGAQRVAMALASARKAGYAIPKKNPLSKAEIRELERAARTLAKRSVAVRRAKAKKPKRKNARAKRDPRHDPRAGDVIRSGRDRFEVLFAGRDSKGRNCVRFVGRYPGDKFNEGPREKSLGGWRAFWGTLGNPGKRAVSDKAVLEAFTEKKAAESKRYVSTGARLATAGMGGDEVARWSGGRIVFAHASTRLVQSAQRAIRRLVPKNWLVEDRRNPKKARYEKKRKRLVEAASAAERLAFRRLTAAADAPGALRRGTSANRRARALAEVHTKKAERLEKLRGGLIRSLKGGKAAKSNPLSARDKAFLLIGNNGVREAVRIAEQRRAHARGHRDQVEERRWQAVLSQLAQIGRKLRNKRNPAQMLGVTALVNPKYQGAIRRAPAKTVKAIAREIMALIPATGVADAHAVHEALTQRGFGYPGRDSAFMLLGRAKKIQWLDLSRFVRAKKNPNGKKRRGSSARPIAKSGRRATRYGDLPARLKAKYRRTALMAARRDRCKLEDVPILWAKTPYRTKRGLLHHGNLHAVEYVFDARSPRSKFARARYRHAAGDNGRGKKKTKAQVVGIDPVTGQWIPVSTRGSRAGFSTERGLIG